MWPGSPHPLGATWDGKGVNVAIFSENAERVELRLFDGQEDRETARIALPEYTNQKWRGYFPDLRPGQLYGLRVYGPYDPKGGHRFNHNKLLLDPYAKGCCAGSYGTTRSTATRSAIRTPIYRSMRATARRSCRNARSRTPHIPGATISRPAVRWTKMIIYEAHVRGLTELHPQVPENLRGTFGALAAPAVLDYLRDLGITAIEFLSSQGFIDEAPVAARVLVNYWGYIAFFAPEARYFWNGELGKFKTMVKALHETGTEVILDVVYNHTAEGKELQKHCGTCDFWGGTRRVSQDGKNITIGGLGWCNNPVSPNYQEMTNPDHGPMETWKKWGALPA